MSRYKWSPSLMKTKTLVATVLALALLVSGYAQTLDTGKLDRFLDRLAEKNKGMGSVTLAKDGHVVYSHSFGYSYVNGAEKRLATATTKYRIASITKTYTAVMIFQLVEEGRLTLSDTLDRFFPQIPNATKITIAHLLNHRSGIPGLQPDGSWGMEPRTKDEVVARIAQGQPGFEPGAKLQYSNEGYILLGQIVEKVGGKPYQDALKERITSRIGLTDTYYLTIGNTDPGRNESLSYRYLDGWKEAAELDFSVPGGAGSILSTPTDMTRFIQAVFDLKLVSADSLKQMTTMRDGEGMGIGPFSFAGKTLYGHTGGSGSAGAWLAYYPEEKLALAYATNMKIYPVVNIVTGIFDIYWNRPFEIPTFDPVEVSPEVLDRYVGVYSTPGAPVKLTITRRGSTLYFQPPGESAVPLEATAQDKFKIDPGVFFEFDAAKGQMTIKRPNGERVFTKEK
jgi:CubicO group peptidase (beta-lactamase class C family)